MSINYRGLDWNASPYFSDMEAAELENNKLREALRDQDRRIESLGTALEEVRNLTTNPKIRLIIDMAIGAQEAPYGDDNG